MAEEVNVGVEKWTLEDGRRAEKRVQETADQIITELHMEPERPLVLQQRIVETKKPMVVERRIQKVNSAGEVIEQRVESTEPKIDMQLREHIEKLGDGSSKEDIVQTLVEALNNFRYGPPAAEPYETIAPVTAKVKSLGLADELSKEESSFDLQTPILWSVVGLLSVALVYVVFFM
jgi:hypothetical protein